jgi:hypothetical protein
MANCLSDALVNLSLFDGQSKSKHSFPVNIPSAAEKNINRGMFSSFPIRFTSFFLLLLNGVDYHLGAENRVTLMQCAAYNGQSVSQLQSFWQDAPPATNPWAREHFSPLFDHSLTARPMQKEMPSNAGTNVNRGDISGHLGGDISISATKLMYQRMRLIRANNFKGNTCVAR